MHQKKSGAILVPFKPGNDEIRGRNAAVQAALAAECEEKMRQKREDVRNVAIIAHVDHGKTTLVDELLKQSITAGASTPNKIIEEVQNYVRINF